MQTIGLNDDLQAWVADVLARINDHNIQKLDQLLLPWNWKSTAPSSPPEHAGARSLLPRRGLHRPDR